MCQETLKQNQIRQDWDKQIREAINSFGREKADEWLEAPLIDDTEWVWEWEREEKI